MSDAIKVSTDGKAVVATNFYYISVSEPIAQEYYGKKCTLINREAGSSYEGILRKDDKFPTHFAPLPTFHPDDLRANVSK